MSEVKVDTISERTAANGVAVDGVTIKDSGLTIPSGGAATVASGGTLTVASGATINITGATQTGFSDNTPAFLAGPSTYSTSTSSNTWVKFVLDSEVFDTDGCFDSSTNYRFTPTTAGKYFCFAAYTSNGLQNGGRQYSTFYKNGTIVAYSNSSNLSGTTANEVTTSNHYIFDMNGSSDYIEFYGNRQDSAGYGYINQGTFFGAYRILT